MPSYRLDRGDAAEFPLSWTRDLESGEEITDSDWTLDDELGETSRSFSAEDASTTILINVASDATPGTYKAVNQITTSLGRHYSQTVFIEVP